MAKKLTARRRAAAVLAALSGSLASSIPLLHHTDASATRWTLYGLFTGIAFGLCLLALTRKRRANCPAESAQP